MSSPGVFPSTSVLGAKHLVRADSSVPVALQVIIYKEGMGKGGREGREGREDGEGRGRMGEEGEEREGEGMERGG